MKSRELKDRTVEMGKIFYLSGGEICLESFGIFEESFFSINSLKNMRNGKFLKDSYDDLG